MHKLIPVLGLLALVGCKDKDDEKVDKCEESGNICTWLGVPQVAQLSPEGVHRTDAQLYLPQDITFSTDGSAYFPDFNNHRIRWVDPEGIVTTVSGTGFLGDGPEGDSSVFAWNHPTDLAIDPNDPSKLHVAAWHNSRIHLIDMGAWLTTNECGTGGRDFGGDDGQAIDSILDLPSSVDFDSAGNMYISDQANQAIRKVGSDGTITTIAGNPGVDGAGSHNALPENVDDQWQDAMIGYAGDGGPAVDALLHAEVGQQADPSSKLTIVDDVIYLSDSGNNTLRKIDLSTGIIDRVAGIPWHRQTDTVINAVEELLPVATDPTAGDGGQAMDAYLNNPRDVAIGLDGEIYIADTDNHCIRVIQPDGVIETFAGSCGVEPQPGDAFVGEKEPALDALLYKPYGVEVDFDGNVYIADTFNQVIRRVAR